MNYSEWHKEVSELLASERPDVAVGDLDPNGSFAAFQQGVSPQQFVGGHLPLRNVAGVVPPAHIPTAMPIAGPPTTGQFGGQMQPSPPPQNQSWIGITIFVVVLVVLAIGAFGVVFVQANNASFAESERKTCQTNMYTIANAVQAYKVRNKTVAYPTIPDVSTAVGAGKMLEDLNFVPECPEMGNHYSVTPVGDGFRVECSDPKHGKWEDGAIIQP